ncbi:MAG: metallophosphoesterase family protein [Desulfobacterales bacterium]|jgi:uncharacterized protein|nr:metallophosphoesterase family protein [Desulfobacteraceae bacterium]MBT4364008.1 metallophosphoesterase family protein [Desulfobacteraceae bacterium]MBT7084856.1 metallophosphoesterase family protein [Desulfobacterales bacterium]MBT7698255.1 metallophosphoesterase family protein [Desulfobacterales bacterium]
MTNKIEEKIIVGVLSDTHGVLFPGVVDALKDANLIVHAGDICDSGIIKKLKTIAPVVAVRGNMDHGNQTGDFLESEKVKAGDFFIFVVHDLYKHGIENVPSDCDVVIFGHTHRPLSEKRDGVQYLNPGSAGQCRHGFPHTIAIITISGGSFDTNFIKVDE